MKTIKAFFAIAILLTFTEHEAICEDRAIIPLEPTKIMVYNLSQDTEACITANSDMVKTKEDHDVLFVMCTNQSFMARGWDMSVTMGMIARSMVNRDRYLTLCQRSELMSFLAPSISIIFDNPKARERLINSGDIPPNFVEVLQKLFAGKDISNVKR